MQFVKNGILLRTTSLILMAILISDYTTTCFYEPPNKYKLLVTSQKNGLTHDIVTNCEYHFSTNDVCRIVLDDFDIFLGHESEDTERERLSDSLYGDCYGDDQPYCSKVLECIKKEVAVRIESGSKQALIEFKTCME